MQPESKGGRLGLTPLVVCALIVLADQLTKVWIVSWSGASLMWRHTLIPGFFQLVYIRNPGAAWGVFGGQTHLLSLLSFGMLVFLLAFRRSIIGDTRVHRFAFGLLLGGIIGNLIDRVKHGSVVDFLDVYFGDWHWPAFNVADSAICVSVFLYILSSFWMKDHPLNDRRKAA